MTGWSEIIIVIVPFCLPGILVNACSTSMAEQSVCCVCVCVCVCVGGGGAFTAAAISLANVFLLHQ